MFKLVEPFELDKIYKYQKKQAIKNIYNDLKYLNLKNNKFKIKDINTGIEYSYFIINKKI